MAVSIASGGAAAEKKVVVGGGGVSALYVSHQHLRMAKLREIIRSYGPHFSTIRARSKQDLCNRLQTALMQKEKSLLKFPGVGFVEYPLAVHDELTKTALAGRGWGHVGDVKTMLDEAAAEKLHMSLLFGEVLPEAVPKMMDPQHLDVDRAKIVLDLGAGLAKLALQIFLSYPHLQKVAAIELCRSRFLDAAKTLHQLAANNPALLSLSTTTNTTTTTNAATNNDAATDATNSAATAGGSVEGGRGGVVVGVAVERVVLTRTRAGGESVLDVQFGDMLQCAAGLLSAADIVICETDVPASRQPELVALLGRLKGGARVMLYHSLLKLPGVVKLESGGAQLPDRSLWTPMEETRLTTSWSKTNGHRFDFWTKTQP